MVHSWLACNSRIKAPVVPDETLTCLAVWPDDREAGQTFLLARLDARYRRSLEDRIRCILFRETVTGFQAAQSTDATCHGGLASSADGFQTFELGLPTRPNATNLFPAWAAQRLLTIDYTNLYSFSPDGVAFTVSNYTYATKETKLLSRTTIVETVMDGGEWLKLVTKSVAGCEQSYRCAVLHRRDEHILEVELGPPTSARVSACAEAFFVPSNTETITLVPEELGMQECTLESGVHNVTDLNLDSHTDNCDPQGFSRVEARCRSDNQIQFLRDCSDNGPNRADYTCQGGWEEEEGERPTPSFPFPSMAEGATRRGFLIARPQSRHSTSLRRVCLMYTVINQTFSWTVGKDGCDRRLAGRLGGHRFNTTLAGPCGAPTPSSATSHLVFVLALLNFIKR